ncbi:hypothetical protein HDV05_002683, partial [Chytridiales sp. JEL 0842]
MTTTTNSITPNCGQVYYLGDNFGSCCLNTKLYKVDEGRIQVYQACPTGSVCIADPNVRGCCPTLAPTYQNGTCVDSKTNVTAPIVDPMAVFAWDSPSSENNGPNVGAIVGGVVAGVVVVAGMLVAWRMGWFSRRRQE